MSPKCYICMEYKTSTWSVCKECLNNRDNKLIEEFLQDLKDIVESNFPIGTLRQREEKWEKRLKNVSAR